MFVDMTGIDKPFGANRALDGGAFGMDRGEVVSLLGANGAGKYALAKIMTGIHGRDAGTVRNGARRGCPIAIASSREAIEVGIRLVPQELSVLPDLSVAENVFLGAMSTRGGAPLAMVRFAEMAGRAGMLLERLRLGRIDPRRTLREFCLSIVRPKTSNFVTAQVAWASLFGKLELLSAVSVRKRFE